MDIRRNKRRLVFVVDSVISERFIKLTKDRRLTMTEAFASLVCSAPLKRGRKPK